MERWTKPIREGEGEGEAGPNFKLVAQGRGGWEGASFKVWNKKKLQNIERGYTLPLSHILLISNYNMAKKLGQNTTERKQRE